LASKDTRLSQVITGSNTNLSGFGDGSVDVTIGDKTETITVTAKNADGTDKTNEEILQSFADQLNDLMGKELDASLFQLDNDGNVQLSVRSAETGYDERIQFSNSSGVLGEVITNLTRTTPENELDASFEIDGVSFTRGQNTID